MEPRWPWVVLAVLVALPFVVFGWRAFAEDDASAHALEQPWVDQLWITAGDWPVVDGEPVFPKALAPLAARSTRLAQAYAPTLDPAVNLAALFTGLWPTTLGFLERGGKVDIARWSIPVAARDHGLRTSAFLQDLLVTDLGLLGFDKSVEGRGLSNAELVEAVFDDWRGHPEQPAFTWIHLASAGEGAANVVDLIERLELAGFDETRHASTLLVVAGLSAAPVGDAGSPLRNDARFRVPLYMALPGDLAAGREGTGSASLVDVAWPVIEIAKWRQPIPALDARPSTISGMQGAPTSEWVLMIGPDDHVVRRDAERFYAPGKPPAKLPDVSVCIPTSVANGLTFDRTTEPAAVSAGRSLYRDLVEVFLHL